jgi:hypothetical protein
MPKDKIKRVFVPAILVMLVAMTSTTLMTGAFAQSSCLTGESTRSGGLHFVNEPEVCVSKDDDSASLTATGEVAGAGTGTGTATLTADVDAVVGCITPSRSNEPRGLQDVSEDVAGTGTFTPSRQGRGDIDVTTETVSIEDFDFECPSANMFETLVSVTFSNIELTIEAQTGEITSTFEGTLDP